MTKEELIAKLNELPHKESLGGDAEIGHKFADDALLDFINDHEITEAFNNVKKWYA